MARLGVWMNGEFVATWSTDRGHLLTYDESWVKSPRARALSLSLPITALREVRGDAVANYFDNLLPDSDTIRRRIRTRHATKSTDAFDLLTAIGRDCVGAVQLLPQGTQPLGFDRLEYVALSEREIEAHLKDVTANPTLGAREQGADFRVSIAGAQEKTALLRVHGRWARPAGATPTTHIFKLPLGVVPQYDADFSDSVENEWLCAQIVKELGLPVAKTKMATFGEQRVLIVERFDRQWMDETTWIARLPQEDLCQATATAPTGKYETDGGPGMAQCLELLGGSASALEDRQQFLLSQLAFWLLAATDGHAKNFSIFLHPGSRYAATPLYDVLSAWPVIGQGANKLPYPEAKLAMAMRSKGTHYRLDSIRARHWRELALRTGGPQAWEAMVRMVQQAARVLDSVGGRLDRDFPAKVWGPIEAGMRRHAALFMREAEI
ncbi:MAG: type II toxin-antitoxin system HipA family toxin [Rhizobacter sp.]